MLKTNQYSEILNSLIRSIDIYKIIIKSLDERKKIFSINPKDRYAFADAEIDINWKLSCAIKEYINTFEEYQEAYKKAFIRTETDKEEYEKHLNEYNERRNTL